MVRRLIEAANYAPSGRNLQRARWIVVRDPEQRRRIGELNRRASIDHATAARDVSRATHHQRRRMWDAVLWQSEHMHEAPVIVVACCVMDDAEQDPGRYASSIWPAVQNLLLAARACGLGAAPTTYALSHRDELEAVLDLPATVRAQAVIPIGFPVGRLRTGASTPGRRGDDVRPVVGSEHAPHQTPGCSSAFEDPHDAVRPVDLDEVTGLDRRRGADRADDGRDAEIPRHDHRVAQLAAHLGHDGDGTDEQWHPSRIGDRRDQHLARLGRVVGVGVQHDTCTPDRDTRAAGGAGDLTSWLTGQRARRPT